MTRKTVLNLRLPQVITAAAFAALAVFFEFALIGYRFMALTCMGAAALILLFELFKSRGMKKCRRALLILLLAGILLFVLVEIPIVQNARTDAGAADYLIVLGAGVNGTEPSLSLRNRLDAALQYLEKHPDCVAIVSGCQGEGEDITEARAMYTWLTARGVAPERVILEEKAENTRQNIRYSLEIIEERGGDPTGLVAVCSSEYHLYRAKTMLAAEGAEPLGVAGRTTYPVLRTNYFIRECFAVLYLWCFGG